MRYVLCLLTIITSGVIGNKIANRYVIRCRFFNELYNLCLHIKNNINFNQKPIKEIFEEFLNKKTILSEKQLGFCLEIINGQDGEELTKKMFYFLSQEEIMFIKNFFKNLGVMNVYCENEKVDFFIKQLEMIKNEAENIRAKKQILSYKLSISVGAIVSILII